MARDILQENKDLRKRVRELERALSARDRRNETQSGTDEAPLDIDERFRIMADTLPNLVWTALPDGRVDYRNRYGMEYAGFPERGTGGDSRPTPVHPDDLQATKQAWKAAVEKGEPYQVELRVRRADGIYRWHLSRGIPVRDKHGAIKRWVGTAIDVHDLRETRSELEKRVRERTADLVRANQFLESEIANRQRAEKSLRDSEKHLRYLSSQILSAQENERKIVAQELHDSIGSNLSAIKHSLETRLHQFKAGSDFREVSFEEVLTLLQITMDDNRRIQLNLRPSILDDLGIGPTISWYSREAQKAYRGISIETCIRVSEEDIPDHLKIILFRIIQESVSNSIRHGQSTRIRIDLERRGNWIQLLIEDNGSGFDSPARDNEGKRGGMGLASMQQRVESSEGMFSIRSSSGSGTSVKAEWKIT